MSLDVYLIDAEGEELFSANITHNLGKMASAAGIYECLWRPDEHGMTHAKQIIAPLTQGLTKLVTEGEKYESLDSPNGWGVWEDFVPWCATYLKACRKYPDAEVSVSR